MIKQTIVQRDLAFLAKAHSQKIMPYFSHFITKGYFLIVCTLCCSKQKLLLRRPDLLSFCLKMQVNLEIWQGHQGSNPGPTVLETVALPAELYPYKEIGLKHSKRKIKH